MQLDANNRAGWHDWWLVGTLSGDQKANKRSKAINAIMRILDIIDALSKVIVFFRVCFQFDTSLVFSAIPLHAVEI